MEIHHPSHQPLSASQKQKAAKFRERLCAMISRHGLTSEDVQDLVKELRQYPELSTSMMIQLSQELNRLLQGQYYSFDWD